MLLKEIKLPELRTKATSNLTAKHLNARYDNDFYYTVTFAFVQLKGNLVSRFSRFLRGAQNTPNTLTVLYTVNATFGDGKSVPNNIYPSEPNKYHVVIQFQNIQVAEQASGLKWTQFLSAPDQKKQQMIQTVINSCDVKLYSDDPSFYWQGVHEVLDKHGVALYPFRGTPGDGQWEARHQGSGGLSGNIYVTKHIAQISEQISSDWRDIVKSIQKNQSIQESFNYDYILSKYLSEKNTLNYKYIFQETYEKKRFKEDSTQAFAVTFLANLKKWFSQNDSEHRYNNIKDWNHDRLTAELNDSKHRKGIYFPALLDANEKVVVPEICCRTPEELFEEIEELFPTIYPEEDWNDYRQFALDACVDYYSQRKQMGLPLEEPAKE